MAARETPLHELSGDRALGPGDEDRLGFAQLADRLAIAIGNQAAAGGLVLGIEGRWGSGKSSLVYLTLRRLLAMKDAAVVVEFRPWLVGDRDALLVSLFSELAHSIDEIQFQQGDATGKSVNDAKAVAKKVRGYAARLGGVGKLVGLAGAAVPGMTVLGQVIEGISGAAKEMEGGPSLAKLKADVAEDLRSLKQRIVVIIDDLDRLEPSEVLELLRVVRAAGDFPNVVYVLCYDRDVLARSIEKAAEVEDGDAFVEKIVQVTIAVPRPESSALRRWFTKDLAAFAQPSSEEEEQRLTTTIDQEGSDRLQTPRAVVRLLNTLRFLWPVLHGKVDLADLVWLQLIRSTNPDFYAWIESYSGEMASVAGNRASVTDKTIAHANEALDKALGKDGVTFDQMRHAFGDILPGIDSISFGNKDKRQRIFKHRDRATIAQAAQGKRLASPDHSRLYFALTPIEGAPSMADYDAFWNAVDTSPTDLKKLVSRWILHESTADTNKAEIIFDRLRYAGAGTFDGESAKKLLQAFADILDDIPGTGPLGIPLLWTEAEALLPALLAALGTSRLAVLKSIYRTGAAVSWLTSVMRHELHGHGRVGSRPEPSSDHLFSEEELNIVSATMAKRFASRRFKFVSGRPRPIGLLFGWLEVAGDEMPKAWVRRHTQTDDALLATLEDWMSAREASLSRQNIGPFVDYDKLRARLKALSSNSDAVLSRRAAAVLRYFEAE